MESQGVSRILFLESLFLNRRTLDSLSDPLADRGSFFIRTPTDYLGKKGELAAKLFPFVKAPSRRIMKRPSPPTENSPSSSADAASPVGDQVRVVEFGPQGFGEADQDDADGRPRPDAATEPIDAELVEPQQISKLVGDLPVGDRTEIDDDGQQGDEPIVFLESDRESAPSSRFTAGRPLPPEVEPPPVQQATMGEVSSPAAEPGTPSAPAGPPLYDGVAIDPPVRIVDAKPAPEPEPAGWPVRIYRFIGGCAEWGFGVASLMFGLAIVASIPVLQFASLGYLLEASGRVARSGKIRDAFMGVRPAARIGGLVAGAWLVYLPLLLINEMWYSAYLIDPESGITAAWRVAQYAFTFFIAAHVLIAWFNGGRLRDYFWPVAAPVAVPWNLYRGRGLVISIPPLRILGELSQGNLLTSRRDAVWDFLVGLRLPHLFWLGLRGFAGAVAWLCIPIMMLVVASSLPPGGAVLFSLLGAALLTVVLLYLPFLQAHFAMRNEMVAMFDLPGVRDKFRRAPIAFWFSLLITLLFALPLYLLKIELTPRETLWIPSLVFVAFMFPARVLSGWVLGLASRRDRPRHFVFRAFSRLAMIPVVMAYVGIVYLTQYLSWYGVWSLFEQHAFLTPAPFLGG